MKKAEYTDKINKTVKTYSPPALLEAQSPQRVVFLSLPGDDGRDKRPRSLREIDVLFDM